MNQSVIPAMDVFQKIEVVNHIAGNTRRGNWADAQKQAHMTVVEMRELVEALEKRDATKLRDAYCDLIVFAVGGLFRIGSDANTDMHAVTDSLLTRFDRTMEDAVKTQEKYNVLAVETEVRTTVVNGTNYFVVVSAKDQIGNNGEHYTAGKFLKSYQYSNPTLQQLSGDVVEQLEASSGVPSTHSYQITADKI